MILLCASAAWFDLKKNIIPNALIFSGAGIGALLRITGDFHSGDFSDISIMAAEVTILFICLWPVYGMGGLGAGDCKLLLTAGVFLPAKQAIFVIVCAFFAAAAEIMLLNLIRVMRGEKERVKKIPFAPAFLLGVLAGWL